MDGKTIVTSYLDYDLNMDPDIGVHILMSDVEVVDDDDLEIDVRGVDVDVRDS